MGRLDFLRSSDPGYVPQLEKDLASLRVSLVEAESAREDAWSTANEILLGVNGAKVVPASIAPLIDAMYSVDVYLQTMWHYDPKTDTAEGLPKIIILDASRKKDHHPVGLLKPFEIAVLLGPVDPVVRDAILTHRAAHMLAEETKGRMYALQDLVAKLK